MSDVSQANEPEARTATGEIKDVNPPTTSTPTPETPPASTPKPAEAKPEKETSSLLNQDQKKEAPTGAPEKYEAFKVPDGHEIADDKAKEIGATFKKLNLTQEQGQELVDLWVKENQEAFDAPFKAWQDTQEKWINEVRMDPDMGHRMPEIKATISRALDSLGDAKLANDFRAAMDITGAGNNPAFIKSFWKLAQAVTEGGHVAGTGPTKEGQRAPGASDRPSAARSLYPNLP